MEACFEQLFVVWWDVAIFYFFEKRAEDEKSSRVSSNNLPLKELVPRGG